MFTNLDHIFASVADGIVVFDRDLRYVFINDAAEKMLAVSREAAVGKLAETNPSAQRVRGEEAPDQLAGVDAAVRIACDLPRQELLAARPRVPAADDLVEHDVRAALARVGLPHDVRAIAGEEAYRSS